jgi:hypothetical protein
MPRRIALQKHFVRNSQKSLSSFEEARHRTSQSDWRTFGVRTRPRVACALLAYDRNITERQSMTADELGLLQATRLLKRGNRIIRFARLINTRL